MLLLRDVSAETIFTGSLGVLIIRHYMFTGLDNRCTYETTFFLLLSFRRPVGSANAFVGDTPGQSFTRVRIGIIDRFRIGARITVTDRARRHAFVSSKVRRTTIRRVRSIRQKSAACGEYNKINNSTSEQNACTHT